MKPASARALGRLVADLAAGSANDVIGASLAAAVRLLRPRAVELTLAETGLIADGVALEAGAVAEVDVLTDAFRRHGLAGLSIGMGVTPREILQCGALLAASEVDPSHPSIFEAARRLGFWHLTLAGETVAPPPPSTVCTDPLPTAPLTNRADAETHLARFAADLDSAVQQGQAYQTALVLCSAVRTEDAAITKAADGTPESAMLAQHWTAGFESLVTPPALALVAGLIPTDAFPRERALAILRRAGDAGTAALMQHLTAATSTIQRRQYFDAIVETGKGIDVLVAHLQHPLWFVVRNAACLLGAMRATAAEGALIAALSHADDRVRTSIATALVQLGTDAGRRALEGAIRDASSDVRRRALSGLLNAESLARSAAVLSEALDLERDPDVQLEVVAALRQLGTPFAIQRLVRLCSPAGRSGKSPEFVRAAMEALAEVHPTVATPLLRIAAKDRDPSIATHAQDLLARLTRAA